MRLSIPPFRPGRASHATRSAAVGLCLAASLSGCGGDSDTPTEPTPITGVTVASTTPSSGSNVVIPPTYPYHEIGGVVMPKDSGVIAVRGTITSARALDFAQVNIYLNSNASGTEYCGQNSPDSPTWRKLPAGWTTDFNVTGYQIYRVPCTVTGIRVIFHSRDDPSIGPPPRPEQIIAESTLPVNIQIRLQ